MPVPKGFVVTSGFGPRWGGYHWGTDFGRNGGSGGQPIYAVRDGLITRAGAASGFGKWITLDVDAGHGGGLYVYGHIIPEVTVGQRVMEGQRIGHINPDSSTNGGVAPHLHFEHHRYVWSQPGPDRLDPMSNVLAGARWKGETTKEEYMTTIFGVDVSEHQNGLSLVAAKDEGVSFAIIRLCDGTYRDPVFQSHLDDAESAGLLVSTYWYLRAPSEGTSIAQQVDVIDAQMGGRRDLPVWIDVESVDPQFEPGDPRYYLLTGDDVWAAKRELERRGYIVPGVYSGAWYWENMPGGEPSMNGLGYLWISSYGSNRWGSPDNLYAGDGGGNHPGWSYPLGDKHPDILQFGSNGSVASFPKGVDVNAFRGTRAELAKIFAGKSTDKEGLFMSLSKERQEDLARKIDTIHFELTERFQSRYKDADGELSTFRDTLVGYVLELDRKVEDIHANMLPAIWGNFKGIFTRKDEKQ
ncbi:hypothetical protein CBE89_13080 [Corynebacterium striatum]|uniref:M23ase beta-sheet core domain-containing protein n=1 Tax=Corynebacterium striatum TaxID=43770 RepID=A0A2Z2J094_CORST|nr:GH25 family lysozyme [Corynebacterium striatum]ART22309.1 hypothetical protein CBE89_13080 [Corynebacterium striatum]